MNVQEKLELDFKNVNLAEELRESGYKVSDKRDGIFNVDYTVESSDRIKVLKVIVTKHSPSAGAYILLKK